MIWALHNRAFKHFVNKKYILKLQLMNLLTNLYFSLIKTWLLYKNNISDNDGQMKRINFETILMFILSTKKSTI